MNRCIALVTSAAALLTTIAGAHAQTLSALIGNPVTGSRYYRLQWSGATWTQMRDYARTLGGDLVTIDDATEQAWIMSNVALPNDKYFIGLNDVAVEGQLVWSDGSPSTYRNLTPNNGDNEPGADFGVLNVPNAGRWEIRGGPWTPFAIIEMSGPVRVPQEFATVAAAAAAAEVSSREVRIGPGTYSLNDSINLSSPMIIRGTGTSTVLQSHPSVRSIVTDSDLLLEDLTIINRVDVDFVDSNNGDLTLRRCRLSSLLGRDGNELIEIGGGQLLLDSCVITSTDYVVNYANSTSGDARFVNTVISDANGVTSSLDTGGSLMITNCVLDNITRLNITGGVSTVINNTILSDVTGTFASSVSFNSCLGPAGLPGTNNRVGNPAFVNAAAGDFRLSAGSAAIDAGDADLFFNSGAPRLIDAAGVFRVRDAIGINDPSSIAPIDIGPFEFQSDQGCDDIDFNNDGSLFDPMDVDAFLSVFSEGPCIR